MQSRVFIAGLVGGFSGVESARGPDEDNVAVLGFLSCDENPSHDEDFRVILIDADGKTLKVLADVRNSRSDPIRKGHPFGFRVSINEEPISISYRDTPSLRKRLGMSAMGLVSNTRTSPAWFPAPVLRQISSHFSRSSVALTT